MPSSGRIGPGRIMLVVGPSGAGKDALLARAHALLAGHAGIRFPERVISRPAHAAEAHSSLSREEFSSRREAGAFALAWQAHGLCYGLPRTIDDAVRSGDVVVANVSRAIVGDARERYENVSVLLVDAPREIRARRLMGRGRESEDEIARRLDRRADTFDPASADVVIDNSGELGRAAEQLVAAILAAAGYTSARAS